MDHDRLTCAACGLPVPTLSTPMYVELVDVITRWLAASSGAELRPENVVRPWDEIHASVLRLHAAACDVAAHGAEDDANAPARDPAGDARLPTLTTREREILGALLAGRGTDEVSRTLHISPHTVTFHVKNVMRKLGVRSRATLFVKTLTLFPELAPGEPEDETPVPDVDGIRMVTPFGDRLSNGEAPRRASAAS